MIVKLYYPVATKLSLLNCNDILSSFYKSEYPIIFKVKGTNYHAAVVKEIHRDVIRIGNEYCSYSKFIEFLHSKKIKGVVVLLPVINDRVDLIYDEKTGIALDISIVDKKAIAKYSFIQDQGGNILLYSEIHRYIEESEKLAQFL